ncbi:hypothetical protein [Falsigemmobacter intermedius]|uniref:hypothetical protein n=1 Tax=Falsigemmobacter intermedius TaxID=1553448 RepID=UPI003F0B9045
MVGEGMELLKDVLSLLSLALISGGAFWAGRAVLVSPQQAVEIGVSRTAYDTFEENLSLPHVQSIILTSKAMRSGLWCIAAGTAIQAAVVVCGMTGEI